VFQGRAGRKEFWHFVLFSTIINFAMGVPDGILHTSLFEFGAQLVFLIPGLAVGFRRMHDTNRSGWWFLLPIVNIVFWCQASDSEVNRFGPASGVQEANAPVLGNALGSA
jgi:uncharacterized membrane protein YhaH (DUF805 family)